MGNVPVNKTNEKEEITQKKKYNDMLDVFCGNRTAKDIIKNIEVNEIILSKTYSYPKGTYNAESIKLFKPKERQLFYFSSRDNVAAIRYLTINGVNINILDEDRTSPLHLACRTGSLQMVEELINQGSMINLPDLVGWTPLHIACFQKRPDVVLLLLKNGANYKFKNRDKLTPFELCANNKECIEIYNNFTIHERIELMRVIQLQKMKLDYIEDYIKNFETNHNNIDKTQSKEHQYMYSISKRSYYCEDLQQPINTEILKHDHEFEILRSHSVQTSNGQINIQNTSNDNADINIPEFNNEEEEEEDDIDDVPNEFVNYNDKENRIKTNKESTDFTQKYLSKYKYIPKKHKFYLQYEMCNGKVLQRSVSKSTEFNSSKENANPLLIHLPIQFPLMTSIQQLNTKYKAEANEESLVAHPDILNNDEHEKYKAYDNDSDCEEVNLHFNQSLIDGNKGKELCINSNSNNSIIISSSNINNSDNNKRNSNEETIQDESTIIEDFNGFSVEISNSLNIHSDIITDCITQSFIQNSHQLFNDFFFHHLKATKESIEELLIDLFHFDYQFALILMLTINKYNNTYESLVNIIRKTFTSKQLKSIVLIGYNHHSPLIDVFLSSFNTSNLTIKDILSKVMSNIINPKDIFAIDRISKSFAKTYYPTIQYTEENKLIRSQNALYCLVFSLIITEMSINTPSSLEQKEKYICDLMILLKDMNEGQCFNQEYLNSLIKYIKSTGFFCQESSSSYKSIDTEDKFSLGIQVNNTYKTYHAYYCGRSIFILFDNKKSNEISKMICLSVSLLNIQANGNMIVVKDRYEGKKGRNVFILHNKKKTIKMKQYDGIKLFLDNKGVFNDIIKIVNSH